MYLQIFDMCLVCIHNIVEHNCQLGHVEIHIVLRMAFEWLTKHKDVTPGATGPTAVTSKFYIPARVVKIFGIYFGGALLYF